ncbi:MAG: hypothetical protein ACE5GE_00385 [Phycisphaerae bacterium]
MSDGPARILYCNCTYAKVVPADTKARVLQALSAADVEFEAVADLCDMSARKDPALKQIAQSTGSIKIAACYPRAVKWLFHAAGAPIAEQGVEILNMRDLPADDIVPLMLNGKAMTSDRPQ